MVKSIIYRLCNANDLVQIHALAKAVITDLEKDKHSDFYDGLTQEIAQSYLMKGSIIFGAFSAETGVMIGYIVCKCANIETAKSYEMDLALPNNALADIAVVEGIAILPSMQNKGIASKMLYYAFSWAKRNGIKYLVGTIHPDHTAGLSVLDKYHANYGTIFFPDSKSNIKRKKFCINIT